MTKRIAVLFGGVSTEYLISLRSAYNIISGLRAADYEVIRIGLTQDGCWYPFNGPDQAILDDTWQNMVEEDTVSARPEQDITQALHSPRGWLTALCGGIPDCIFPAVHGINCEDGALQGFMTLTGIPFVGSGILASAAAMDKLHTKRILRDAGIPQCAFMAAARRDIETDTKAVVKQVAAEIGYPCFLKPSNGGSSVGTRRADNDQQLYTALRYVCQYDRNVLIEPFVSAREVEVAVVGNQQTETGMIGEIVKSGQVEYYDYQAKYFSDDGALVQIPADLLPEVDRAIKDYASRAYRILGCAGLARIDFFIEHTSGEIYLNEINTLPGFTPISVYPKAFDAAGLPLSQLVSRLCLLAIDEHKNKARLESVE